MKSKEVKKMSFYKKVPGLVQTLESALLFDTKPTRGSTNPVTSEGVAKAAADIFDDGDETGHEIEFHISAAYNKYELNKYYVMPDEGKLYVCTRREKIGEEPPYTYNITLAKLNGVAAALNQIIDLINE